MWKKYFHDYLGYVATTLSMSAVGGDAAIPERADTGFIHFFDEGLSGDHAANVQLLGGKGAGLSEMTRAGLPVPPGFTITTEACLRFYELGGQLPPGLEGSIRSAMSELERRTGKRFGNAGNPLLVSVRSGAAISMPGMMDTILNLGLNDRTVVGLATMTQDERFAWDAYRRFISMFGHVVLHIDKDAFESILHRHKERLRSSHGSGSECGDLADHRGRVQSAYRARDEPAVPPRRQRAARSGGRSRLRFLELEARRRLPCLSQRFPATAGRRSASFRWSSEISATTPGPASPLPAIRTRESPRCSANIS